MNFLYLYRFQMYKKSQKPSIPGWSDLSDSISAVLTRSPSIKGDAKFRNFSNCIFFPLNSANFHSWHGLKNPKTVTFVLFSANLETTELPLSKLLKSFSVIWQDFYTIFFPNFQWLKCVARKNHNKKCSHIFWLFYLE